MARRLENMEPLFDLIRRLPVGQYFDIGPGGQLEMQAEGEVVIQLRRIFGGKWTKGKSDCGWWTYTREETDGVPGIYIYADRVGPKSCKRIEEVISETVHVPAHEAYDEVVKRSVVRWECPDDAKVPQVA